MRVVWRWFSGLSKNTFLLTAGSLFADISTEMLTPVLPIFLTQTLHAGGTVVGLVDGIAQAMRNVIDGFSGWVSDKLRRRKSIALAGYALSAVAKPLMGLSTVWEVVLAGRLMDRLGAGTRSAPRDALVAASADRRHRGRAFGLESFGDNAGAFVGPILTLCLLYLLEVDLRVVFYLALVPGLLAFLIVLQVMEQAPPAVPKARDRLGPREFPAAYWRYLAVTAIFSIGNSSNAFLILRTQESGASLVLITLIYAVFNLVAALVSFPVGSLSDSLGRRRLLLGCFGVFVLVYLGFCLTVNLLALAALFVVYGVYQGIFRTVGKALASDFVSDRLRASAIGWYSATAGLFQLIASLIAGVLWDTVGHAGVFVFGVASGAGGIVALLVVLPRKSPAPAARAS